MLLQTSDFKSKILKTHGAGVEEIEELSVYNQNLFDTLNLPKTLTFPLESESHITIWQEYLSLANKIGVWSTLKNALVQLNFPVQEGISQTDFYRAATLKGTDPQTIPEATGLVLQEPEKLGLRLHQSLAGTIPVLLPGNRSDFEALVRALTKRNEPQAIPASMGACMIGGYNNWDRIRHYRQQWFIKNPDNCSEVAWQKEFKNLIPQKELYRDCFIILSNGFYSDVAAEAINLTEAEWREFSLTIRLEHECTHYFTRRLFGSMQNNLLDELIADYRGITAVLGYYRADWFLRFMGLESFPKYRASGRLQNYRGKPPLSDRAFAVLQALVVSAANNLEQIDRAFAKELELSHNQASILIALANLSLEELASDRALLRFREIWKKLQ